MMLQDVLSSLLVILLSYVAHQIRLGRKELRRDRRLNRKRFAQQQQQIDEHTQLLIRHEAILRPEEDHGQEGQSGDAA